MSVREHGHLSVVLQFFFHLNLPERPWSLRGLLPGISAHLLLRCSRCLLISSEVTLKNSPVPLLARTATGPPDPGGTLQDLSQEVVQAPAVIITRVLLLGLRWTPLSPPTGPCQGRKGIGQRQAPLCFASPEYLLALVHP